MSFYFKQLLKEILLKKYVEKMVKNKQNKC